MWSYTLRMAHLHPWHQTWALAWRWWQQRDSSGHTAVDSGAFTAGRKGERLGWRNFKDCCRQEGLGTLWSGQSCRSNPIAACLEDWR